jgi:superfamily II DNA/RNA helicase
VCDYLPNKKILIWCGTIARAKHMYQLLINDNTSVNIFGSDIFIDHSEQTNNDSNSYKKFKSLESNCIMVCADKYQTGSDIEYLDCVVFADMIHNKSQIVFIQCIGRVQRLGYNKTIGYVIDHYDSNNVTYQTKISDVINKLITYYWEFYTNSMNSDTNFPHQTAFQLYNHILSTYKFVISNDEQKGLIKLCLNQNLTINIHTGLNNIVLNDVKIQFKSKIANHIKNEQKLDIDDILRFEYKAFGLSNIDFFEIFTKQEYMTKILTFHLEPHPETIYAKIWTNWYDYLNISTTSYPSDINE